MQRLMPDPRYNYRNMADAFTKIIRYEGLRNTVRGMNAVVGGAGPAHAMYFACYEKMKKVLSRGGPQNAIHHGIIINTCWLVKFTFKLKGCYKFVVVAYSDQSLDGTGTGTNIMSNT